MTKPSTAFSWTTVATYRDAIPSGLRDSGFIPNTLVSSGYTNQALFEIGEWVTYLSDLSPADDVLAFREWECPDDSSYQLAWNGPAGTDGRMDVNVERLLLSADTSVGLVVPSGPDAMTLTVSTSFGGFVTDITGASLGLTVLDPTSPTDDAGIEVDADSGDVTLFSDYGTVTIPVDTQTPSQTYTNVVVPLFAFMEVSNTSGSIATVATRPDIVINGGGTAETIGYFDLGQSTRRLTSPATSDSISAASFEHGNVTGSGGGTLTFDLYTLAADGTLTAVTGGGGVVLTVGDSAGTLGIGVVPPQPLEAGERLLCRVTSNATTVSATIFGAAAEFSSTHIR